MTTTQAVLDTRRKDSPSIDEVTTLVWTHDMGKRLSLVRMKLMKEQKEIAAVLGVTQSTISRIEIGHLRVCEAITVKKVREVFEKHFSFIVFGTNPERYNGGVIVRTYWDTRLRLRRNNKGTHSKSRVL